MMFLLVNGYEYPLRLGLRLNVCGLGMKENQYTDFSDPFLFRFRYGSKEPGFYDLRAHHRRLPTPLSRWHYDSLFSI